ncbi:hypothetical protein ACMYLJ_23320, partial [Salmonella enterica subsp. enterica serovar Enteritidis]
KRKTVCIDKCLEKEIIYLWSNGIRTTGCCCGHNNVLSYIGVVKEDVPLMKKLGYKKRVNPLYPEKYLWFIPKGSD